MVNISHPMVRRKARRDGDGECFGYSLHERTSGKVLGYNSRTPSGSPFVITKVVDERIESLKGREFDTQHKLETAVAKLL